MKSVCDGKTKLKGHRYAKWGNAMVYMCNYEDNVCTIGIPAQRKSGEMLWELSLIDRECGYPYPNHVCGQYIPTSEHVEILIK